MSPAKHSSFDTVVVLEHPNDVEVFARRVTAVALVFAFVAGNLAVCAGWETTPEARMACCANARTCPMHKSDSQHATTRAVSQREADRCCAASERGGSTPTSSSFAPSMTVTLVASPLPPIVPIPPLHVASWRALVPLHVSTVPTHLLLSVLLV
jgi:hypothetical protein